MSATVRSLSLLALLAFGVSCDAPTEVDPDPPGEPDFTVGKLAAHPPEFHERGVDTVTLSVGFVGTPDSDTWTQLEGPPVAISRKGAHSATVDIDDLHVAAPTELVFEYAGTADGETQTAIVSVVAWPDDFTPALGPNVQIGGSTAAATAVENELGSWVLYSVGNRFSVTPLGGGAVASLHLPGFIHEITPVTFDGRSYALVAMGEKGIAVVALDAMDAPTLAATTTVNFFQDGITFAEGGGDIIEGNEISGASGSITSLATDGETLWIGDASYGIHRTALANLLGGTGPVVEADGTLQIDAEVYTLQYAGEVAWGGPLELELVDGRLFASQGFLGLVIYDADTLDRVGSYNLYLDTDVVEDWFIDDDVAALVQRDAGTADPFLDPVTGMPDYRQANFEIAQVWHGDVDAPTPWADFDRYGKYYYNARAAEVVTYEDQSIAYVAYGLGGLIAVDVTGFADASVEAPLVGEWLGYAPAVPAHGPDEDEAFGDTKSLYPHFGAGMLKESGVVDVQVRGDTVWYGDHFAGFVAMDHASTPGEHWHGPHGAGNYDNDDPTLGDGVLGDHWPDYEFVTSYDMSPWDETDNESLPQFLYEAPTLVASGEITGHGGPLYFLADADITAQGGPDLLQCAGGGGLNLVDVIDLAAPTMADRFVVTASYPTTDEVGAAADGSPTAAVQIGHSQGVTVAGPYLYVGDGPHGVSAWRIADETGAVIDDLHLVANSLQDEYPVDVDGETIYPMPHASVVAYDAATESIFALSQSAGLRRADVSAVQAGQGAVGSPLLFAPEPQDLFEHNVEEGNLGGLKGQDHAYDVAIRGELAFVADGSNGLTIYDLTADPSDHDSGFVVGNLGAESGKPGLGRATGVSLWSDPHSATEYAFVAAGPYGVGVVDVTDPTTPVLVKLFEPIKMEDDTVGKADGRCVDVHAIDDVVYFSYSSFGLVAFSVDDLIAPLPEGVEPDDIWSKDGEDHRPEALARIELTDVPGYEAYDYEALYMEPVMVGDDLWFFAAGGAAGLMVFDWTDPTAPALVGVADTVGEATSVAVANGRVYVADGSGGFVSFR